MQNHRKQHHQRLSVLVRAILVLMLILPAFSPASGAAAMVSASPQTLLFTQDRSGVQADPLLDENFDYGGVAGDLTAMSGGEWGE